MAPVSRQPPPPPEPLPPLPFTIPPILLEGDEPVRPLSVGPGEKFALGIMAPAAESEVEPGELPEAYGTGMLMLLPRDPHCLYAHWDLPAEQQKQYNSLAADQHLVLRVYQDGARGKPAVEVHTHPESQHWFVHVPRANALYVAELGYYRQDGEWMSITQSAETVTPADTAAEEGRVEFGAISAPVPPPEPKPEAQSPKTEETPKSEVEAPKRIEPVPVSREMAPVRTQSAAAETRYYPTPAAGGEERWAEAPPTTPLPASIQTPGLAPIAPAAEAPAISPPGEASPDPAAPAPEAADPGGWQPVPAVPALESALRLEPAPGPWTEHHEQLLAELIGDSRVWREPISSADIIHLFQPPLEGGVPSETAAPMPSSAESPAGVFSPLEAPAGLPSSQAGAAQPGPGQFWFNINAELIIYGATEPDARVTIGGRPIQLRPDGSFSYRFALPDGEYELLVSARSAQVEDHRQAGLRFFRRTEYGGEVAAHPQDPSLKTPAAGNVA
jgi:hypothetical protein